MSWNLLTAQLRQAAAAVREYDEETLHRVLDQLVPEFAAHDRGATAEVIPISGAKAG